jgi:hypothetical protein
VESRKKCWEKYKAAERALIKNRLSHFNETNDPGGEIRKDYEKLWWELNDLRGQWLNSWERGWGNSKNKRKGDVS